MALQGNPFLGKLKIPAPDLSRVPETPFNGPASEPKDVAPPPVDRTISEKVDRVQTGSEIGFNRVQTGSEIGFNRVQESIKPETDKPLNPFEPVLDRVQTGSITGSKSTFRQPAYGELAVMRYFADREESPGSTIYTRRREIAESTYQTINGVKTALRRLREAGLIQLNEYERGPNRGITSYRLTQKAHEVLASKSTISRLGFNRVQTGSITGSNGFSSSSSKDLDLNTTNTGPTEPVTELPGVWASIDLTPLASIRFGQQQLLQLVRVGVLTPSQLQESIYAFAFDLEVNNKGREMNGPALNYFMGILRRGPYTPPANYEPPETRQMRQYLEAKKREQLARTELESQLETIEFDGWVARLSAEEKSRFVPPADFAKVGSPGHNAQLKQYFREQVWPDLRDKFLKQGEANDAI
jgi:hypothetical protein